MKKFKFVSIVLLCEENKISNGGIDDMAQGHMAYGWLREMEADRDVSSMCQMCLWIINCRAMIYPFLLHV